MTRRKRDLEREILEGIRELERGRVTTVAMKRESKTTKRTAMAPSSASPMTGGQVLSVEVSPDEEVERIWTHDPERGSFVTGYRIVPQDVGAAG